MLSFILNSTDDLVISLLSCGDVDPGALAAVTDLIDIRRSVGATGVSLLTG
jgi:hypothetical protein